MDMLTPSFQLDGTPLYELEATVSNMPPELRDLYSRTLSRIEGSYAEEAYIMLQIALCCLQPLSLGTFFKCTDYIKWGRVSEGFESRADMIRRLKSRSGGLLEIAYTIGNDATQANDESVFERTKPYKLTELARARSSARSRTSEEMDNDRIETSAPVVQFIHQTVKEFIRDCRETLGLPKVDNRQTTTKESGYLFLIRCGMRLELFWAERIRRDIFLYAYLAETEGNVVHPAFQELFSSHASMDGSKLARFLSAKEFESYSRLLPGRKECDMVIYLAVAANLFGCVRHYFSYPTIAPDDMVKSDLLQVAVFGPKIGSGQDGRLDMVNLLLELRISPDTPLYTLPLLQSRANISWWLSGEKLTILSVLLAPDNRQLLAEEERFLIAESLVKGGASCAIHVLQSPEAKNDSFALEHCIRYESGEMVRLFLQDRAGRYGAGILSDKLYVFALLRRDPSVLSALEEYCRSYEVTARLPAVSDSTGLSIRNCGLLGVALCGAGSSGAQPSP